jgi:hypothetical protein
MAITAVTAIAPVSTASTNGPVSHSAPGRWRRIARRLRRGRDDVRRALIDPALVEQLLGNAEENAALLESVRLNREPPSIVQQSQEAVRWLSRAIIDLHQETRDAAAAIAEGLGHALALDVFADVARRPAYQPD